MNPYYQDDRATVLHGDCLELMAAMPDASFDAVVTDPPYGLRFMGAAWDGADIVSATRTRQAQAAMPDDGRAGANGGYRSASTEAGRYDLSANASFGLWCQAWASECLRVLKPGGHLLAFGGSRTWHRLACAVEDAGFEIRDSIAWLYGSGFPKSLDVSKAIDKAAGALEHEGRGFTVAGLTDKNLPNPVVKGYVPPAPATSEAERWQGWGTALKPAFEPVVCARKPLVGTVASNVLAHGTGALNIGDCRVGADGGSTIPSGMDRMNAANAAHGYRPAAYQKGTPAAPAPAGRWPANVVLDESQAEALDQQSGTLTSGANPTRRGADKFRDSYGDFKGQAECTPARGTDRGGASRFFYVAKAPQSERPKVNGIAHPTVKPLKLTQWLIRLVTPPGGHILDPFAGSGTTAEAALRERVRITAIEREADYLPLILHRIERHEDAPEPEPSLFDLEQPA